jgi:hypothetical protein
MNTLLVRWSAIALLLGLFTVLSSGCVVPGDGYGYNGDVGVGVDYYEPYGAYYGGWGSGYRVGPIRGDNYRPDYGGRPIPRAYSAAPVSRPVPSIPARRRSGNLRHQPLQ